MAYTHSKYEVLMLNSEGIDRSTITVSTHRRTWAPGYQPHICRAIGIIPTTSGAAAGARRTKISLFRNSTPGATVTTTLTLIDTATLGSLLSRGKVQYIDGLNTVISPGQELVAKVTQIATQAAKVKIMAYVEPVWEVPANNSNMADRT